MVMDEGYLKYMTLRKPLSQQELVLKSKVDGGCISHLANRFTRIDDLLLRFLVVSKLASDHKSKSVVKMITDEDHDEELGCSLLNLYKEFLSYVQGIGQWLKVSGMSDDVYIQHLGQIVMETLGFMALKQEFKQEFLEACSKQVDGKYEFVECLNYLMISSIQYNAPTDN